MNGSDAHHETVTRPLIEVQLPSGHEHRWIVDEFAYWATRTTYRGRDVVTSDCLLFDRSESLLVQFQSINRLW